MFEIWYMTQLPFLFSEIEGTIHQRFRKVAGLVPDSIALETHHERVTYAGLDALSDRIARLVAGAPATESPHCAIWMENGVMALATILGILKAGRSFVILPPGTPSERLRSIWEDALRPVVVTTSASAAALAVICPPEQILQVEARPAGEESEALVREAKPSDAAAVFYTSGSSGESKGVIWTHELILHAAFVNSGSYRAAPGDRYAMMAAYGFGAAMTMSFVALLSGATLLYPDMGPSDLRSTIAWLRERRADALAMPPVEFMRQLLRAMEAEPPLTHVRMILLGGDALYRDDVETARRFFAPTLTIVQRFGGSEAMLMCENKIAHDEALAEGALPIGRPVQDKEVTLLDEDRKPVAEGEIGEMAIRSRYLSPGYWRRPELDAAVFLPDPDGGARRMYLTGDMARRLPDGKLEYLGRKDQMVKVHGYSVHLEWIDRALRELDGVRDGAASVYQTAGGAKRLAAYLVPAGAAKPSADEMRERLAARLASYMIPSAFVWLESLPRTKTGKLDRKSLPLPPSERPDLSTPYVAPGSPLEEKIAAVWQTVLGVDRVGVTDNFFELGGDSLLALQMSVEVEKILSTPMPQSFFASPNISFLARLMEGERKVEVAKGKFVLAAQPSSDAPRQDARPAAGRIAKYASRRYSWIDVDRAVDRLMGWQMSVRPYFEAGKWAVRASANKAMQRVLFRRRYELFSDFMASLPDCHLDPADIFQQSLLANLNFSPFKFMGEDWREIKNDRQALKQTRSTYWRTLVQTIEESSVERLDALFPMAGFEHMQAAFASGRGVILLTFHGVNSPVFRLSLARRMNVDAIPAISHRIPARQSEFGDVTDELPYETASALNTQIALFAQKRLQEGNIVYIVGDTSDAHGPRYPVTLGGRAYQVKAGFAELALNTGAAILPFYGRILPDSRSQIHFLPPLDPGPGTRAVQAERLVAQYAAFVNRVWSESPEILWWNRIRRHLMRPQA